MGILFGHFWVLLGSYEYLGVFGGIWGTFGYFWVNWFFFGTFGNVRYFQDTFDILLRYFRDPCGILLGTFGYF